MPVESCTVKNNNKWLYHGFAPARKILSGLSSFVCEKFPSSLLQKLIFRVCLCCISEWCESVGWDGKLQSIRRHRTTRAIKIYQSTKVHQKGYKNNFSLQLFPWNFYQHLGNWKRFFASPFVASVYKTLMGFLFRKINFPEDLWYSWDVYAWCTLRCAMNFHWYCRKPCASGKFSLTQPTLRDNGKSSMLGFQDIFRAPYELRA